MKRSIVLGIMLGLFLTSFAIAYFVNPDNGFKYDTDHDNWITLDYEECLFWMENHDIPVVIVAGDGSLVHDSCYSQTLSRDIPCENQACNVTAANFAIALARRNYDLISPKTTTTVSTTTEPVSTTETTTDPIATTMKMTVGTSTTTIDSTTTPGMCDNIDESCGTWPDCWDLTGDDICKSGGIYWDYWCLDNVPMVTTKCTDSCCRSWFGSDAYCEGDECVYGEGDTATTTIPMQGTGEYFIEEGQSVTCPTSGYDYCSIELRRVSDDRFINSYSIPLGESRTTSTSYYYTLYGVVE